MSATTLAWLALLTPVLGAGFSLAVGPGVSRRTVGMVCSAAILAGFACSVGVFIQLLRHGDSERNLLSVGWHWLSAGSFRVDVSIVVDPLSCLMLLVVTGIGFLIHAYSVGYMGGDREERRFFAYMNIFVFSMLLLVLAGNFLILLAGWGLVGLSSYLLIGFWWERPSAVAAAKKAFVMNAVGDVGIAIALFVIFDHFGTLDYTSVFSRAPTTIGTSTANWICLLLLVGAVAKSAQIPLQTWLPDAMEGPTPVSALIHAATMVTAGVYLVARMWPLFDLAPDVRNLVAIIGAATLTMAGLIALVQVDIKRVIAYSTMSQIGYMFCGVGIGAYSSGMFLLVAHAFFKALLFLGAGVVIHALDDEQDMRRMGGMSRYLPFTAVLMWIGGLSLAGMPPFAGFFAKDQILADALARGGWVGGTVFALGAAGALVTGLYTFRMIFMVFSGEPSGFAREHAPRHTAHGEGPFSMLWTITVLAAGSILVGFLEVPGAWHLVQKFLSPGIPVLLEPTSAEEWVASLLSVALGLAGILTAYALYGRITDAPARVARALDPLPRLLEERLGFDAAYNWAFYRPAAALASTGARLWEEPIAAGSLPVVGGVLRWTATRLSMIESGLVRAYAIAFGLGLAAISVWFLAQGIA